MVRVRKHAQSGRRISLDRSLIRGIAWNGVARWTGQIVSWAVLLYAARVLTPGDFGYVAMAMVPIGLARLIEDLGLDAVIVQNQHLSEKQIASLGGLALMIGIGLALLYILLADFIAEFYHEPVVAKILTVLSALFVLDALQIVPRALLQKELQFGRLAFVNGVQISASALILGICVYLDMSFWALVLNHVLSGILIVLLLFYLRSHALSWPSKLSEITGSLKFGLKILISRIAWYGYSNADQVILGRIAGADSLGAFNFAMTFARIPVDEISSLSGKVVPGVFSSIQHSPAKLSRYVLLLTEATSYLTIPATIGIALVAGDFVPLAIGPQWQAVVLPLQILGIHACILSVTTLWSHVYIWTGNIRINMYLSLLSLVVLPPVFYFGARYGAVGVALGWTIMAPIMLIPGFLFLKRILKMRFSTFMNCLGPALISTALMCLAIAIARYAVFSELSQVLRFVGDAAIGAATYFTVLIVFFRRRVQRIVQTVRRSI